MKVLKTDKFTIELKDGKYFLVEFFEDAEIEVPDVQKLVSFQNELGGGKKFPAMNVTKPGTFTGLEVLKFIADDKNIPYTIADAFVLTSIGQRILANLYKRLNPNKRPTGYFKTQEEALKWLAQFM